MSDTTANQSSNKESSDSQNSAGVSAAGLETPTPDFFARQEKQQDHELDLAKEDASASKRPADSENSSSDDSEEGGSRVTRNRSLPAQSTSSKNFLQRQWDQSWEVLRNPAQFFETMQTQGGYREPVTFAVVNAGIYALLMAIGNFHPLILFGAFFHSLLKVTVITAAAHFALQKLGGKGSLEASARVNCYSKATLLFAWVYLAKIPVGGIASTAYCCYLAIRGMAIVHKMENQKLKVALVVILATVLGTLIIH